ncbi:MAG: hypothetical protein CL908_15810 [Deltaproteobacteria bacterium]|nr:hypothetical protein [Deltaproteobacteria bacterium]
MRIASLLRTTLLCVIASSFVGFMPRARAEGPGDDPGNAASSDRIPGSAFEDAEEMIVSASRAPRARSTVPSFTTVLAKEDLDTSISSSLADVLRFVPGLQLTQEGGRGGRAQLALRGLDPNHVVVLIDGVRLNDPTNSRGGSFDPTTLALVDIERVEVVRGPLSSVYGSDALAGVINVVTRKVGPNDEPIATVRSRAGRFHAGHIIAQASAGIGGVAGLSLGAAVDSFRDPNSDGGYDGASLKAKLSTTLPFEVDFEAFTRIHQSSARSFPESSGGPELAGLREMEDRDVREILFGVSLRRNFGERVALDVRASRASRRERLESPGIDPEPLDPGNFNVVPGSRAGDEYKRWDLALISSWQVPAIDLVLVEARTKVLAGVDFVWEDGESDTYLDAGCPAPSTRCPFFDERRTIGIYAEAEEQIGQHIVLSAAMRFDTTPDEKDRVSPSAGVSIDVPGTPISLFSRYGEGFKRPSFYALGHPLVGDSNLLVEKSHGWELGVRGQALGGRIAGQISYFDIRVKDIIVFDTSVFRLRNERRLISRGVELELGWRPSDWAGLRGGVTFNPTDFEGTSSSPENRSRWRGFGEIVLRPTPTVEVGVRMLGVGPSKASSFHTGNRVMTLAGYERVDLRLAWLPTDWLDLIFEIENLTDRTYREAVGFEAPGIAPRAGATIRY